MDLSPLALAGIFLSGLALNLTPCVYPMLSVTVALFGAQTERRLPIAFARALIYVSGMALMYSVLGAAAALTGGFFGQWIQNQWVLLALAFLMFLLALSMFGAYEFQMPAFLLNWVGGRRKAGVIGLFFSGLFVGIFAAPCIGPPIVALLTLVGQSMNPVTGFSVFFILAMGLGLPYLILGTFSGLLTKLPKSGEWLLWVKKVFGTVLLGLALFYLAMSLYPEFLNYVFPVALLAGGVYLGFVDRTGEKSARFRLIKKLVGSFAVIVGLLLLFIEPAEGVKWEPYSPQRIVSSRELGTPVVINFHADWCFPCHELDRYTFTHPEVVKALEPFARLKADVTNPNTEETMEPINRFDILGVPTILFLDPKGNEVPKTRITGYVPAAEFLRTLGTVQDSFKRND